jgi:nicotinate-nucleotide--dimethylbenzimidazole phosphoribosyltransferase
MSDTTQTPDEPDASDAPEGPDLAAIALAVRWPPVDPQDEARAALAGHGLGPGYGRLTELAVWWASVRGDERASPPRRVVGVGITSPLPDTGRVPVRRVPWPPGDTPPVDALAWGVETADALADEGVDLLLVAVDDAPARRVLAAALLDLGPVDALGWPQPEDGTRDPERTGLVDDARWMDEATALREGLRRVRADEEHPVALLRALGSPVLAAAAGLLLQATARRTPVLLDGPGAAAAGLFVRGQAWETPDWWQVAQGPADALHDRTVAGLRMTPLPGPAIAAEDGTAALLAADVVAAAASLLTAVPAPPPPAPPEALPDLEPVLDPAADEALLDPDAP